MSDKIHLLSDHIANQIAAGEVIQRPASAVKELLENAIDAKATEITLNLKDAGKELIQVIDNGIGMSSTDARMCFARHATSKIKHIDDLFAIRTMGFRGEALASIAAVAKVEMKTRQAQDEAGTRICIEASEVIVQEPCATPQGTNLMIKNLFYNIPARRHFLKSNTTELKHIWDEFTRIALANPHVVFRLRHNDEEQKFLEAGNLKTRIVSLFGHSYEKNLVPVEEKTDLIRIYGFIGKPESATRTRGMQFFFINNRYIRSPYLNHAVQTAFEGLIAQDTFPFYLLMIETDPAKVDVNVHPTKQEVKFEDERLIYAYLSAAVKHALARYNIAPSLDFTLNPEITQLPSVNIPATPIQTLQTQKGYLYQSFTQKNQAHLIDSKDNMKRWKELYAIAQQQPSTIEPEIPTSTGALFNQEEEESSTASENSNTTLMIQGTYLLSTIKSGLVLIHIRRAQERICYDRIKDQQGNTAIAQKLLYPETRETSPSDAVLYADLIPALQDFGFELAAFGPQTFILHAAPSEVPASEAWNILEALFEHLKQSQEAGNSPDKRTERLHIQLSKKMAQYMTPVHTAEQQQALIAELFSSSIPEYAPDGKKIFTLIRKETLDGLL